MIVGLVGDMGSGKTLIATYFAYHYFKKCKSKIYANYHLNFPFEIIKMSQLTNPAYNFSNSVLIIDEIHQFLDSRLSGSKKNRTIGYFITQSRKRNIILLYTTQQAGQADKRLRGNTDYFIRCTNLSPKDAKENIFIQWEIIDSHNKSRKYAFKADPYFKLYDTTQVVPFEDEDKNER